MLFIISLILKLFLGNHLKKTIKTISVKIIEILQGDPKKNGPQL